MYKNLVALLLCLMPLMAIAKQSYPPYPEVWGYDISDDADTEVSRNIRPLHNGDYYIHYNCISKEAKNQSLPSIIHFFEGTKKKFSSIENQNKYIGSLGKTVYQKATGFIVLKDKKIIDVATNFTAAFKFRNNHNRLHYSYVRRIDSFDNANTDYAPDNANTDYALSTIGIATFCGTDGTCEHQAYFLTPKLKTLKDDTFFAFDDHYNLFIRFDRDFKTKFKPEHRVKLDDQRELKSNFYILPYSKVLHFFDHIAKGYVGEYTDDVNRQFLDFLFEEESKGNI